MFSSHKMLFSLHTLIFTLCLQVLDISAGMTTNITATITEDMNIIAKAETNADWWQEAVIYQIYPRSFMDSNADGVGDLQGIIMKLPYLAETGITAVWLNPIFKSPMVDFGYDIADFKAIHDEYGTMQDFEELIEAANKLGIKIILDFVPNHSSDQCDWFKKSAQRIAGYEDFYVWADGKLSEEGESMPPNNWQSVFGGPAWSWHEQRQQYYLHQFTVEQPDLNFRNPKVVEAMDDVLYFWLNKGVSGFRIDAVNHLFESPELLDEPESGKTNDTNSYDYTKHIYTKDLPEVFTMLQRWRKLLHDYTHQHAAGPTRIMMTEAYANIKTLMDYYENAAGVCAAHFPFNFVLITSLTNESDARDYVFHIQQWLTYMPRGHFANWVLGNHDNPRVASRFGAESVDAMNMLLMTLPGVAVTYNGDEIGMEDYRDLSWEHTVDPPARIAGPLKYKKISRDPERTPFQWNDTLNAGFSTASKTWLPVHPNYKEFNLAQQKQTQKSHYNIYKALIELRKMPTLRKGRTHLEVVNRNVFAFRRLLKGYPTVITIINVGALNQSINLTEIFNINKEFKVLISGINSSYENGVIVKPDHMELMAYESLVCMYG